MAAPSRDKVHVHFGRGGAGNSISASSLETRRPSWIADFLPPSSSLASKSNTNRRYSTGIGGTGNISFAKKVDDRDDKDDEEVARLLYDRSAPGIVLVEGGHHTGIGGFANRYRPSDLEDQEARLNNESMRRQSLASVAARRESMASFAPSSGEGSRRGSIASLRDFIKGRRGSKA